MTAMSLAIRLRDRLTLAKGARAEKTDVTSDSPPASLSRAYAPVFFNEREWSFLIALIEAVVPDGEDGGRDATGVPMFIDRRMASSFGDESCWHMLAPFLAGVPHALDYQLRFSPRDLYRRGIAVANKVFFDETGHHFSEASDGRRRDFLIRLAAGRVKFRGWCGQAFFQQLLTDIKRGCTRVG